MEQVTNSTARVGDGDVLALFDEFASAGLVERGDFAATETGELVVAGVKGADRFGDFCRFACEEYEKVTFAVVPTNDVFPLVVFNLECIAATCGTASDGCPLHNETDFDMLVAADLHCPTWELGGRTFRSEVLWPKNFANLPKERPPLPSKKDWFRFGFDLTGKAEPPCA